MPRVLMVGRGWLAVPQNYPMVRASESLFF
jgi:hypothetical protein